MLRESLSERAFIEYLEERVSLKKKRDYKENTNLYRGRIDTDRGRDFNQIY